MFTLHAAGIVVLTQVPAASEIAGIALVVGGVALHRAPSGRELDGDDVAVSHDVVAALEPQRPSVART